MVRFWTGFSCILANLLKVPMRYTQNKLRSMILLFVSLSLFFTDFITLSRWLMKRGRDSYHPFRSPSPPVTVRCWNSRLHTRCLRSGLNLMGCPRYVDFFLLLEFTPQLFYFLFFSLRWVNLMGGNSRCSVAPRLTSLKSWRVQTHCRLHLVLINSRLSIKMSLVSPLLEVA